MMHEDSTGETTRTSVERGVTVVELHRPERRNALSEKMLFELLTIVESSRTRASAGLIIRGANGVFSAGADIGELQSARAQLQSAEHGERIARTAKRVFEEIERAPIPVIACVDGYALGGGCELALACDLIFATHSSWFAFPESTLGLLPGFGGTRRLIERVGPATSVELVLLGTVLTAEQAAGRGLVARTFDDAEGMVEGAVSALGDGKPRSRAAIRLAKDALGAARTLPRRQAFERESHLYGRAFAHPDSAEGIDAFLSKRTPNFRST